MDAQREKAAPQDRLRNTPDRNYTAMKRTFKHGIVLLALWGLLTPKTATAILKALGVRHA